MKYLMGALAAACLMSGTATNAEEPLTFTKEEFDEVLVGMSETWTCAEFLETLDSFEDGERTNLAKLTLFALGLWGQGYAQADDAHGQGGTLMSVAIGICLNHPDILFSEIGKD